MIIGIDIHIGIRHQQQCRLVILKQVRQVCIYHPDVWRDPELDTTMTAKGFIQSQNDRLVRVLGLKVVALASLYRFEENVLGTFKPEG